MTDKDILEKAIQKAIDGGWTKQGLTDEGKMHFTENGIVVDWLRGGRDFTSIETIIFNHDFAKALWGDEMRWQEDGENSRLQTNYKYHLQQMVIADDPIKYLGENL